MKKKKVDTDPRGAGEWVLRMTRDENGCIAFTHEQQGNWYYYEIIGLISMHTQDLITMSKARARKLKMDRTKKK